MPTTARTKIAASLTKIFSQMGHYGAKCGIPSEFTTAQSTAIPPIFTNATPSHRALPHRARTSPAINLFALKYTLLAACFIPVLAATGCQTDPFSPAPPALLQPPSPSRAAESLQDINAAIHNYQLAPDPKSQAALRNQIIEELMNQIDQRFIPFDQSLWQSRAVGDFSFDMANLSLTFAATLAGGEQAKSALAAVATLLTGAKTAVSADFYEQQTAMALSARMHALRAAVAADIRSRLSDDPAAYPLYPDALRDIQNYYTAGTLLGALSDIQSTSGAQTAAAALATQQLQNQPAPQSPLAQSTPPQSLPAQSSSAQWSPTQSTAIQSTPSQSSTAQSSTARSPLPPSSLAQPFSTSQRLTMDRNPLSPPAQTAAPAVSAPPAPKLGIYRDATGALHLYNRLTNTELPLTPTPAPPAN